MSFDIFVLEVVLFIDEKSEPSGWAARNGKFEHIGYMDAKFKTKDDACSYYDRHNKHMRPLNALGTYKSDWDPIDHRLYIVREDHNINSSVAPFSPEDSPIISRSPEGTIKRTYSYLK